MATRPRFSAQLNNQRIAPEISAAATGGSGQERHLVLRTDRALISTNPARAAFFINRFG